MEPKKAKGTALITGASSGIGSDLARVLAAEGHDLALVARSEGKLRELGNALAGAHKIRAHVIAADLADPSAPEVVVRRAGELGLDVSVLVNNAGFAAFGKFVETDLAEELRMIQVNITAVTHLTKLLVPKMLARGGGRILNLASTAAFQPGPLMAVYFATKAYVLSWSEALANELRGTGVTVTALCPGPTTSGFQAVAHMEESRLVRGRKLMDSMTVARAGVNGMKRGKTVVIPGLMNKLIAQSVRLTPRKTVASIVRSMQERVH